MPSLVTYIQLTEQKETKNRKVAVFAFGRFNPPTRGHEKLIKKTHDVAKEKNADVFIFPSQTHGKRGIKENPLPFVDKVAFMQTLMPWANIVQIEPAKDAWKVLDYLVENGYTEAHIVAGSDRVSEYETRWLKYANEVMEDASVISAGMRDPDGSGVAGMSGTKAQKAARDNDIGAFRAATGWEGAIAERLMKAVAKGLNGDE